MITEFPGCITEGDSAEEALMNLESAAESWVEAALDMGQEIPPPHGLGVWKISENARTQWSNQKLHAELGNIFKREV